MTFLVKMAPPVLGNLCQVLHSGGSGDAGARTGVLEGGDSGEEALREQIIKKNR